MKTRGENNERRRCRNNTRPKIAQICFPSGLPDRRSSAFIGVHRRLQCFSGLVPWVPSAKPERTNIDAFIGAQAYAACVSSPSAANCSA